MIFNINTDDETTTFGRRSNVSSPDSKHMRYFSLVNTSLNNHHLQRSQSDSPTYRGDIDTNSHSFSGSDEEEKEIDLEIVEEDISFAAKHPWIFCSVWILIGFAIASFVCVSVYVIYLAITGQLIEFVHSLFGR